MKYKIITLLVFLALPAVAAAPREFVSTCDVQMQIRDGRNPEGLPIRGQSADLILPCITKDELARIIEDFAKGDAEKKDRALDALNRAKQVKIMLTPELAMQERD